MHPNRHAFSLVELSIVLVILGLLVGGILAGQSLIAAAELRSIGTQQRQFLTATQAFRDKYRALPGDMTNATSFWGIVNADPATCQTTAGTGTKTCDGNGDNLINLVPNSREQYRYWQHLANAGLVEGTYPGIPDAIKGPTASTLPASKRAGLWFVDSWGAQPGGSGWFVGTYDNTMQLGIYVNSASSPYNPILTPEEMWNLDTKLDDGWPATGKLVSPTASGCVNFTTPTNLATTYKLTSTAIGCTLWWRQAF